MTTPEQTEYEWARRRAEAVRGFNVHVAIYLVVNLVLMVIDLLTPGGYWFYWPLIGWGLWVVAHGISVHGGTRLWGREWEERKIKQFLAHHH